MLQIPSQLGRPKKSKTKSWVCSSGNFNGDSSFAWSSQQSATSPRELGQRLREDTEGPVENGVYRGPDTVPRALSVFLLSASALLVDSGCS